MRTRTRIKLAGLGPGAAPAGGLAVALRVCDPASWEWAG
jgi:hypothetical protein